MLPVGSGGDLDSVDFVPSKRNSVLFPLSLRKLCENQVLTSCRQSRREGGGNEDSGLEEK